MKTFLISLSLVFSLVFSGVGLVQAYDPLDPVCQQNPSSPVCQRDPNKITGQDNILIKAARVLVYITGIASVIMVIIGGFTYVTSGGDSQKISAAKNTILYALIGVIVAISAQVIINFVLSRVG